MFKAWSYEGFWFDDTISAYFKEGGPGFPAYSMGHMAKNNSHLREKF